METRHQDARQKHKHRQFPHVLPVKLFDARDKCGFLNKAFAFQCQEGKRICHDDQDQPSHGERKGTVEAVPLVAKQDPSASGAFGHASLGQRLDTIQQITLVAGDEGCCFQVPIPSPKKLFVNMFPSRR